MGTTRRPRDVRLLVLASVSVLAVAGGLAALGWRLLEHHPVSRPVLTADDPEPEPPRSDLGTRCGSLAVDMVRRHAAPGGATVGQAAEARLGERASGLGKALRVMGWRGREDRERRGICRVSLRYELGDDAGASVWLVDPEALDGERLQPQDGLSVEVTARVPLEDAAAEQTLAQRCEADGVDAVKRRFSYMERYDIWGCLRKRAAEVHGRESGPEVVWGAWRGRPEARDRCVISVDLTEDGQPAVEHYRLTFMPDGEHVVEPLTPRAIESIYGPGVHSR